MPDLSSLAKIGCMDSSIARIADDLKLSRAAQSHLDERKSMMRALEPYARYMEFARSAEESWVTASNATAKRMDAAAKRMDAAAKRMEIARLSHEHVARLSTTSIPARLTDALETTRAIMLIADLVKPEVLEPVQRLSSAWANLQAELSNTTRLVIDGIKPQIDVWNSYRTELQQTWESVRFPLVEFGSAAMQAFLEQRTTFQSLLEQERSLKVDESGSETAKETESDTSREPQSIPDVIVRPFPANLLRALRIDPNGLNSLTPEQFELLIADRLEHMGFDPVLTGGTNLRDGGIDIIAVPRKTHPFGCLMAVQCEHHSGTQKTGRNKGRNLLEWKGSVFQLGVLVTNTAFTKDMRFAARQPHNRGFLRLREFNDVSRWIQDNYEAAMEWAEIPDVIELAPGILLRLPKR